MTLVSRCLKVGVAASILTLSSAVKTVAQDFSTIPYSGVMSKVIHKQQMKAIYGQDLYERTGTAWKPKRKTRKIKPFSKYRQKKRKIKPFSKRRLPHPTRQATQLQSLKYRLNPTLTQLGRTSFIQKAIKNDPQAGQQLAALMQRHDVIGMYQKAIQQMGLEFRNPADSMTSYNLIAWLIANEDYNLNYVPPQGALLATRHRVEQVMVANPNMATDQVRQLLDEEFMYRFITLHAAWQNLAKGGEGDEQKKLLSNTIHQQWKAQFGQDLRQLNLTANGFVTRQ